MAYEIHITRNVDAVDGGPVVTLAEWVEAITQAEGVRLADGDYLVTLPETGQVFRFPNTGGDAELLFADGVWRRVFRWHGGRVSFVAREAFRDPASPVRSAARLLAAMLEASLVGDAGEVYD